MEGDGYILIPDALSKRKDLTWTQKGVCGEIGRIQGKSASCYPSIEFIAEKTGLSESTTRRAVNDLVRKKEVVRLFHHNQTSTYSAVWATARNLRRKWALAKTGKTA